MTVRSVPLRQNPAYRPGTSHHRIVGWLFLIVTSGACRRPIPRQPVVVDPPPAPRHVDTPKWWRLPLDPLPRAYALVQEGRVVTTTDSSTFEDSVALRVEATVRRTTAGGAAGIVRSAEVRAPDGTLQDLPGQALPFAFTAGPYAQGIAPVPVAQPPATDPCASTAAVSLQLIGDLLFTAPDSLYPGRTWADSAVTNVCRGGVVLTLSVSRVFRFRGPADRGGTSVLLIDRTSRMVLSGAAGRGTDTTRVSGSGGAAASLVVDPETGAILTIDGTTRLQLTVRSVIRTQRAEQTSTLQVRRLDER